MSVGLSRHGRSVHAAGSACQCAVLSKSRCPVVVASDLSGCLGRPASSLNRVVVSALERLGPPIGVKSASLALPAGEVTSPVARGSTISTPPRAQHPLSCGGSDGVGGRGEQTALGIIVAQGVRPVADAEGPVQVLVDFHPTLRQAVPPGGLRGLQPAPPYICDQLGHHSIQLTVDCYAHLLPGANKAAVDRLDTATIGNPRATTRLIGNPQDAQPIENISAGGGVWGRIH